MNCLICEKEFEALRKTAMYCSATCRKLAFQDKGVSVPKDAKVSVPVVSVLEGYCHGCNLKVSELICICHACINKGITHKSLGLKICEQV